MRQGLFGLVFVWLGVSLCISAAEYVGTNNCIECHQTQYQQWQGSHHDMAMRHADKQSILGDFANASLEFAGKTNRFFRKGAEYWVNIEGLNGEFSDYQITYTFGFEPLQQYMVEFADGRVQLIPFAWDSRSKQQGGQRWFHLYPNQQKTDEFYWTNAGQNWNYMCADCHSTNVRKNYSEENHSYTTKYALINVSCEACHGPGKSHVSRVEALGDQYKRDNSLQMTYDTAPKDLVDKCARCHMRREQFSKNYNYEGTLLDHYFPQLITEPIYHADGQILDEVYVYGSFVQSKMYQKGVTCTNCHDAHTTKLKFDGNKLCYQCHNQKTYNNKKHHFHQLNTEGSKCINCHMTGKYYMGNDFRRDHSFRIPRPDLSVKYNTPNACNGCHKNKDSKWASSAFKKMFGNVDSIHFSEKLI